MVVVKDIAYVRYQAPDLTVMEEFLSDFGLHRSAKTETALYMRGRGPAHHVHITELGKSSAVLGFGLIAQSSADLIALADRFEVKVEDCTEPGGGQRVRLIDPDGLLVDVIHGWQELSPMPHRSAIDLNPAVGRKRYGATVRVSPGPSNVMRIGHVALIVGNFQKSFHFYHDVLGMRPSDSYWAGAPENMIAAFMHCGLGESYTDHHTVALISAQDGVSRMDHSAFEVLDLDDLAQGNAILKAKGYKHSWGIGRHVQGSQIFDYWRDPYGNKIEHWTDGDLVNDQTPAGHAQFGDGELAQWGPPLNPEFFL